MRARLLRVLEEDNYELAHEYLIAEISRRISQEEIEAKLIRELLQREVESWRGLGKPIEPAALQMIHERRDDLRRLNAGELELLLRSALAAGYGAIYWFGRAQKGGVAIDNVLPEGSLITPAALRQIHEHREGHKQLSPGVLELLTRSALAAEYEIGYWFERVSESGAAMDDVLPEGSLITPTALRQIHERREELERLSPDVLKLLARSVLAAEYEVGYWFERAQKGGAAVHDIALKGLRSTNFRRRAAAVTALSRSGERFAELIIEMLADDYPQVCAAAIHALERLHPDGAWRQHLKFECYVPAGAFIMGKGDEAHQVFLDAFYIGKYPVTNTEYKRYGDDTDLAFEVPAGKADHPVVRISWHEARAYADWAGMRPELLISGFWGAGSWSDPAKSARSAVAAGAGET